MRGVGDNELWRLIRDASFTAFISLHEGFGLPVAESLACGTPVLTTAYGSQGEIAAGGGCLTVDPRDDEAVVVAFRRMLTDRRPGRPAPAEAVERPVETWGAYADERLGRARRGVRVVSVLPRGCADPVRRQRSPWAAAHLPAATWQARLATLADALAGATETRSAADPDATATHHVGTGDPAVVWLALAVLGARLPDTRRGHRRPSRHRAPRREALVQRVRRAATAADRAAARSGGHGHDCRRHRRPGALPARHRHPARRPDGRPIMARTVTTTAPSAGPPTSTPWSCSTTTSATAPSGCCRSRGVTRRTGAPHRRRPVAVHLRAAGTGHPAFPVPRAGRAGPVLRQPHRGHRLRLRAADLAGDAPADGLPRGLRAQPRRGLAHGHRRRDLGGRRERVPRLAPDARRRRSRRPGRRRPVPARSRPRRQHRKPWRRPVGCSSSPTCRWSSASAATSRARTISRCCTRRSCSGARDCGSR